MCVLISKVLPSRILHIVFTIITGLMGAPFSSRLISLFARLLAQLFDDTEARRMGTLNLTIKSLRELSCDGSSHGTPWRGKTASGVTAGVRDQNIM